MSDERETPAVTDPGAPVEETNATDSSVQDAVDRAAAISETPAADDAEPAQANSSDAPAAEAAPAVAAADAAAEAEELQRREALSQVATEMNIERPAADDVATTKVAEFVEMPSAAAAAAVGAAGAVAAEAPVRDGEIRISPDHPMASLYMQTPTPPDLKGNRGAGVLISLVATVAFALLYAGIIALWIAPAFPPSTFLTDGLLPWVTSWGFIAGVAAFFIGMVVLVVIFNRAGWWAYVIFSLFVGVFVWGATLGAFAFTGGPFQSIEELAKNPIYEGLDRFEISRILIRDSMFMVPVLGAGILAREVAIWFGAWIGARGRKVRNKNSELLAEYETALAEVQAQK